MKKNARRKKGKKSNEIRKHDSSWTKLILILLLVFIIGAAITTTFYFNYKIIDYFIVNTSVKVADYPVAGLNADTDSLIFGKTYPGGGGTRYFDLQSKEHALVIIKVKGEMASFLTFSNNSFIIEPGEVRNIAAYLEIPKTAKPGNYSGKIHVYFLRP